MAQQDGISYLYLRNRRVGVSLPKFAFDPPIIAHRGASISAPENTLAAFLQAIDLGIKWIEFDVVLAACGEAIIFHDTDLKRTTNAKGSLKKHPYEYLKTLDAGSWFSTAYCNERIPTLKQVLELIQEADINVNIELKPLPGQQIKLVDQVIKLVRGFKFRPNQILYSSFSIPSLKYLRKLLPAADIGLLLHWWRKDWQALLKELDCISFNVYAPLLTQERAKLIKNVVPYLLVYTVNDVKLAKTLFDYGVDAIFTDDPKTMLQNLLLIK